MLNILLYICCGIAAIIVFVLVIIIVIKIFRALAERRYIKIKIAIEKYIDQFILGTIDAALFQKLLSHPSIEKVAINLLLERLEILSGNEAQKITAFIQKTRLCTVYSRRLDAGSKWKLAEAVLFIGKSRCGLFIDKLTVLLTHPDDTIKIIAANALTKINNPSSIAPLIQVIDHIDPLKAHAIVDCIIELCNHHPSEGIPLITVLLHSPKEHLKYWGCVMLGELHSFDAIQTMHAMIKEPSTNVRAAAVEALGKIGDTASYESISLALLDPDWHVRLKAAWALGELKYANAAPALSRALMDRQWEVNNQAVRSLIAVDASRTSFIKLINSDFQFIRWRAAESLEITGYIQASINSLDEPLTEEKRSETMKILLACAENGARIPFYNNLNNKNEKIKNSVKEIIDTIHGHS